VTKLTDLGFTEGEIVETIVTTYDVDGRPNAAPMGATVTSEQQLVMRLFNSSSTFKNLQANKFAVVNITSDIEIFYKTAFKETNPQGTLPQEWFEKAQIVNAPELRRAEAAIEISTTDIQQIDSEKSQVVCDVKHIKATASPPKAYSRAFAATIEAIVHATRVKVFVGNESDQERVSKLFGLIKDCNEVVNRTAPRSRYSEIMADLIARINLWRAKNESLR
jgi:hypothetical protein